MRTFLNSVCKVGFNKRLNLPSVNVYIYNPYPGTELYYKYQNKLRNKNGLITPASNASKMELSEMTETKGN